MNQEGSYTDDVARLLFDHLRKECLKDPEMSKCVYAESSKRV